MIKDIINGIARKLAAEFKDIKIYSEKVEQGFAKPCFAINCESIDNHLYRGRRYRTDNNIDIHYYSDTREDVNDVMSRLFRCLEYINIPGSVLRGENMKMEVKEDYCSFKVSYGCFYFVEDKYESDLMGELDLKSTPR